MDGKRQSSAASALQALRCRSDCCWPLRAGGPVRLVSDEVGPFGTGEVATGGLTRRPLPFVGVQLPTIHTEGGVDEQVSVRGERGDEVVEPRRDAAPDRDQ